MYTWKTLFLNSFIIDSDLDLFFLTNYFMRMMQAVLRQRRAQKFRRWARSLLINSYSDFELNENC